MFPAREGVAWVMVVGAVAPKVWAFGVVRSSFTRMGSGLRHGVWYLVLGARQDLNQTRLALHSVCSWRHVGKHRCTAVSQRIPSCHAAWPTRRCEWLAMREFAMWKSAMRETHFVGDEVLCSAAHFRCRASSSMPASAFPANVAVDQSRPGCAQT